MHSSLKKLRDELDALSNAVNAAIPDGEKTLFLEKWDRLSSIIPRRFS